MSENRVQLDALISIGEHKIKVIFDQTYAPRFDHLALSAALDAADYSTNDTAGIWERAIGLALKGLMRKVAIEECRRDE